MDYVLNHWRLIAVALGVLILLGCYRWVLALCGVILVPDDSVGVVTKKFVIFGKNRRLPAGRCPEDLMSRDTRRYLHPAAANGIVNVHQGSYYVHMKSESLP